MRRAHVRGAAAAVVLLPAVAALTLPQAGQAAAGTTGASGASGTTGSSFGTRVLSVAARGKVVVTEQEVGPTRDDLGTPASTQVLGRVGSATFTVADTQVARQRPELGTTASGAVVVRVERCDANGCTRAPFHPIEGGADVPTPPAPSGCAVAADTFQAGHWYAVTNCKLSRGIYVRRHGRWIRLATPDAEVDELDVSGHVLAYAGVSVKARDVLTVSALDLRTGRNRRLYKDESALFDLDVQIPDVAVRGNEVYWVVGTRGENGADYNLYRRSVTAASKLQAARGPVPFGALLLPGRLALTGIITDDNGENVARDLAVYRPTFR